MRILVTGAAGLYGVNIIKLLVKREDVSIVYGVDNFCRSFPHSLPFIQSAVQNKKFSLLKCNYIKIDARLLDKLELDVIIHLAALVSIPESMEKSWTYFINNEVGTFALLQQLLKTRCQPALIYASSAEVYGVPKYLPMDENHPLNPRSVYSVTKLASEKHCMSLFECYDYPVTIIRNFNTYGENQGLGSYAGVIAIFINNALKNRPLYIHGNGNQTRDFLYVKDAVRAYSLLIDKTHNLKGEIFNIGTGKQTSINELAKVIIRLTNSKSEVIYINPRRGDLPALCADISKIKEKLEWEPEFSLEKGLQRTISWYKSFLK
mgnify:CR=1 FL=1|jgi:UDP-glucose 4-epimerase